MPLFRCSKTQIQCSSSIKKKKYFSYLDQILLNILIPVGRTGDKLEPRNTLPPRSYIPFPAPAIMLRPFIRINWERKKNCFTPREYFGQLVWATRKNCRISMRYCV